MFTLAGKRLFSSMCQHGMVNEELWRSSFDYMFILMVKGVNGSSKSSSRHYLALGSCGNRRNLF
jgi:hypothetical protein